MILAGTGEALVFVNPKNFHQINWCSPRYKNNILTKTRPIPTKFCEVKESLPSLVG